MIALIGATGYVGQAFVKELVNRKLTFLKFIGKILIIMIFRS